MALQTAPCPTCGATLVFGERRCRGCGMTFDYGPNPPREPSPLEVFDAIAATTNSGLTPMAPIAPVAPQPPAAPPPAPRRRDDGPALADIDTGRFSVGDVAVEDVPGFIDSGLFKSMTPGHVDVEQMSGLETTRQEGGDAEVYVQRIEIEGRADEIGDVTVAPVPGLFGSDLFKADVDIAAGASLAGDMLQVTPNAGRPSKTKKGGDGTHRTVCASCSTVHFLARCPICGTAIPGQD